MSIGAKLLDQAAPETGEAYSAQGFLPAGSLEEDIRPANRGERDSTGRRAYGPGPDPGL